MSGVDALLVGPSATVRDALARLDSADEKILLLRDGDGRLLRTITDGDIRRLLLSGANLDTTLDRLAPQTPITLDAGSSPARAIAVMDAADIDHLVLVKGDRICGVLRRHDLSKPVLLSTPHMSEHERLYVEEAFATNWIAPLGPNVDAFEREVSAYLGSGHAAAVVSGTAAIHLGLSVLGVGAGDVVLCSSLTFIASCAPVAYLGAEPVFVDSDEATWNMCPRSLERALEGEVGAGRTPKAVIVVNLYGQSADYDPIKEICARYGVALLEDAAESLGSTYKGRASGTLGTVGIFSFNGNKIITTSGGGMIVSQDEAAIARCRFLSTQAREPVPHYEHAEIGYNYRMSNILAGVGRGQLRVLDERIAARRLVFDHYQEGLADLPGVSLMPEASYGRSNRWLTALRVDPDRWGIGPDEICRALNLRGIEARRIWKPMHLQPVFRQARYYAQSSNDSISDRIYDTGLCLPSGSNTTHDERRRVIKAFRQVIGASA